MKVTFRNGPVRDFIGYGPDPPRVEWPDRARIAVSLVVNYEEGSELSPDNGDPVHEELAESSFRDKPPEVRDLMMESQWEYGSRAGVWRLLRIFKEYGVKTTFFVSAMALEKNPPLGPKIVEEGHDVCGHGYRWVPQWNLAYEEEKETVHKAIESIKKTTGKTILGWFTKSGQSANTRDILREEGLLYDCDGLNDDLPYYTTTSLGAKWLVVPYAFDSNDMKFLFGGWDNGETYLQYLKDSFDMLYKEGESHPKVLSIGLHSRICGLPGRAVAVERLIRYIRQFPRVWIAGRDEIAWWWTKKYG